MKNIVNEFETLNDRAHNLDLYLDYIRQNYPDVYAEMQARFSGMPGFEGSAGVAGKEWGMTREELACVRKRYGDEYLYRQLAEECMELGHAALKLIRAEKRETPMPVQDAQQALIEEIADVRVMLFVLEKILDTDGRVRLIERTAAKDKRMAARLLGE